MDHVGKEAIKINITHRRCVLEVMGSNPVEDT